MSYQNSDYTSIEMSSISMNRPSQMHVSLNSQESDKTDVSKSATTRRYLVAIVGSLFLFTLFSYSSSSSGTLSYYGSSNSPTKDARYAIPTRYHTVIELHMPYLGLVEPFEIWTDMKHGLQRMNYWGDLNRFYLNKTGPGCQIMPVSIDGKSSVEISAQIPLWEPAVVFPDLGHPLFSKSDKLEKVRGVTCEVWEMEEKDYDFAVNGYVGRYRYFVSEDEKTPIRMAFIGHNTITDSHFDNYTFDYLVFENTAPAREDLTLENGCSDAPTLFFDDDGDDGAREALEEKEVKQLNDLKQALNQDDDGTKVNNGDSTEDSSHVLPVAFLSNQRRMMGVSAVTNKFNMMMPGAQAQEERNKAWGEYQIEFNKQVAAAGGGGADDASSVGRQPGYSLDTDVSLDERRVLLRNTLRVVTAINHQHIGYTLELNNMADWTDSEKARRRGKASDEKTRTIAEATARLGGLMKSYDYEKAFASSKTFRASDGSDMKEGNSENGGIVTGLTDIVSNIKDVVDVPAYSDKGSDDSTNENEAEEQPSNPTLIMSYDEIETQGSFSDVLNEELSKVVDKESDKLIEDIDIKDKSDSKEQEEEKEHDARVDADLLSKLTADVLDLPRAVDWRKVSVEYEGEQVAVVGSVKDQGTCGSCWTFGTAGSTETHAAIKKLGVDPALASVDVSSSPPPYHDTIPALVTLSEQAIVDCAWPFGVQGCDGGEDDLAYLWIMNIGGLPTTSSYGPYMNADANCHANGSAYMKDSVAIQGYYQVPPNSVNLLKAALAFEGPVSVTIDASPPSFYYYSGGLYKPANKNECHPNIQHSDHIVVLVGYGVDEASGEEYWILRNSWSEFWGEGGYMRIAIDGNPCGTNNKATFPIIA